MISKSALGSLTQHPQWIELYNTTDKDINLHGYRIVGRYLTDNTGKPTKVVELLETHVISTDIIIKSKQTLLITTCAS